MHSYVAWEWKNSMWILQIVSIDSEIAISQTLFSLFHPLSHNIGMEFMQKPSSAFFFFENFAEHEGISSSTQFSYHVEILRLFQNSHAPIVRRKEQKHSSQAGIKAEQREKICVCRKKKRKARQRRGKKGGKEEISVTRWRQLWVRHRAGDDVDEDDTTRTSARVLTNFPFFCTAVRRESCREENQNIPKARNTLHCSEDEEEEKRRKEEKKNRNLRTLTKAESRESFWQRLDSGN